MIPALTGRTALVTGGGSGLGRVMARHLAQAGCRVVAVGRDPGKLAAVEAEFTVLGLGLRTASCDVSDFAAVEALRAELADEDVSILVNNAGIGGPVAPITEILPAEWDEVFGANVRSIYLMCRAFLPPMYARGDGDVVNIASVTGKRPLIRRTPYAASKMAVLGLTRTLAFEAGPQGVRVNALSPGPVRGERMARNFRFEAAATGGTIEEAERAFVSRAALDRLVEEDEVGAGLVAMLQIPGMCGADIDLSAGMIAP
ncbi:NAD(P)-dependent dehydrogenase (short-subunit alcohol dehydrogenase family) [Actinocorallia herbida]|uniref:NAD(P)-dependent dehydrogenase (Short-subunit alcohol dehydrogenase family) n=1 Tax=Actinocorallia herbida TaxID=58109 RepID=A0A3N1CUZ3_9ACTN|nr:SDR family oxidoreductase [Actinocorallia herbida]ROO85055.1 NAD(P)-dependent dehydrogenase (short-subunit alcohol dehydrogenase family) [Actinocorallia herbida]